MDDTELPPSENVCIGNTVTVFQGDVCVLFFAVVVCLFVCFVGGLFGGGGGGGGGGALGTD